MRNAIHPIRHFTSHNDYLLIIYVVYFDAKLTIKAHNSLNIKFEYFNGRMVLKV